MVPFPPFFVYLFPVQFKEFSLPQLVAFTRLCIHCVCSFRYVLSYLISIIVFSLDIASEPDDFFQENIFLPEKILYCFSKLIILN